MDYGLSAQQALILRRARSRGLRGARRPQLLPPLWVIALASLLPLLLIWHPGRYLGLLLIPPLGFWHRQRVEQRLKRWALDLRQCP